MPSEWVLLGWGESRGAWDLGEARKVVEARSAKGMSQLLLRVRPGKFGYSCCSRQRDRRTFEAEPSQPPSPSSPAATTWVSLRWWFLFLPLPTLPSQLSLCSSSTRALPFSLSRSTLCSTTFNTLSSSLPPLSPPPPTSSHNGRLPSARHFGDRTRSLWCLWRQPDAQPTSSLRRQPLATRDRVHAPGDLRGCWCVGFPLSGARSKS